MNSWKNNKILEIRLKPKLLKTKKCYYDNDFAKKLEWTGDVSMHNNGHHHCTGLIKVNGSAGVVLWTHRMIKFLFCPVKLSCLHSVTFFPGPHDVTFPWVLRRPKILAFKWLREPRAWIFTSLVVRYTDRKVKY